MSISCGDKNLAADRLDQCYWILFGLRTEEIITAATWDRLSNKIIEVSQTIENAGCVHDEECECRGGETLESPQTSSTPTK